VDVLLNAFQYPVMFSFGGERRVYSSFFFNKNLLFEIFSTVDTLYFSKKLKNWETDFKILMRHYFTGFIPYTH
jgi:hypothetical protein